MKSIGNIYLSWRPGPGSPRILVGVIKNNATDGVRFVYLAEGALEARKLGFSTYEGFPDVTKVYTQNVLRIFGHRILQAAEANIEDYFNFWHIDRDYKSKPYYMLAYTQGMLPSDHFEFLASFNPSKDFLLVSEISGLTNAKHPAGTFTEGEVLRAVLDPKNKHDKHAVKLYKGDVAIGYVKAVHSRVFYKTKKLQVTVRKVEQDATTNRVFITIAMPSTTVR